MAEQAHQMEEDRADPRLPLFLRDGLGEYDLTSLTGIVKHGQGHWFHAVLSRTFFALIRHAAS